MFGGGGNGNLQAGVAGAAVGAGLHYLTTAAFNPCTRNRGTNNRIVGNQQVQSGLLGALAGFAAADLVQAFPLVGTLWGIGCFGEFRGARGRTYGLLLAMYGSFISAVVLLALSVKPEEPE